MFIGHALTAHAQDATDLTPGRIAPANVVQQMQYEAPVRIGAVSVRPLPQGGQHPLSTDASQSTLVARTTDNLIGVSANEMVVIEPNASAVQKKIAELAADAAVRLYAGRGITVVRVKRFSDLPALQQRLAEAFPTARFDLPVMYIENEPH